MIGSDGDERGAIAALESKGHVIYLTVDADAVPHYLSYIHCSAGEFAEYLRTLAAQIESRTGVERDNGQDLAALPRGVVN